MKSKARHIMSGIIMDSLYSREKSPDNIARKILNKSLMKQIAFEMPLDDLKEIVVKKETIAEEKRKRKIEELVEKGAKKLYQRNNSNLKEYFPVTMKKAREMIRFYLTGDLTGE